MAASSSSKSSKSYPSEWIVSSLPSSSSSKKKKCNSNDVTNGHSNADDEDGTKKDENKERNKILQRTHLVLHLDINETILLGDAAGGDTRNESIQKLLAKSAFCRLPSPAAASITTNKDHDRAMIGKRDTAGTAADSTRELQPTHWWDGQEMGHETKIPPLYTGWDWPENSCPYYRTAWGKRYAKVFTKEGKHGHIYQPILHACETALSLAASSCSVPAPASSSRTKTATRDTHSHKKDGNTSSCASQKQNTILPAFYETLVYLIQKYEQEPVPFTIVFRTFGSDLEEIVASVTDFAQGHHPQYPTINFPPLCCTGLTPPRLYQGPWKMVPSTTTEQPEEPMYELWNTEETHVVASGDTAILDLLTSNISNSSTAVTNSCFVVGIRDDYRYWKAHAYHPTAGKPLWVPLYHIRNKTKQNQGNDDDEPEKEDRHDNTIIDHYHHVLFDDNIAHLPHLGIACLRQEISRHDEGGKSAVKEDGTGVASSSSSSSSYSNVAGTELTHYQGRHLIRVRTIAPVLNPQWYIEQLQQAQTNFAAAVEEHHQQQH